MKLRASIVVFTTLFVLLLASMAPFVTGLDAAPVSASIALSGSVGSYGWYTSPVTATVNTIDNGCGIKSIKYSLDYAAEQAYPAGGIAVDAEGIHHLSVTATNTYGDTATATSDFAIDTGAPAVSLIFNGQPPKSTGWYNGPVALDITGTDTVSGMWLARLFYGTSPLSHLYAANFPKSFTWHVTGSAPGSYTCEYTFGDRAGNSVTSSVPFGIDTQPPTASVAVNGPVGSNGWYTGPVTAEIVAKDTGGSGIDSVSFSLNGATSQEYTGPIIISQGGHYKLDYLAADRAGNQQPGTFETDLKIDDSAPAGTPALAGEPGSPGWYRSQVSVDFSGITDADSGIDHIGYVIDGTSGSYAGAPVLVTGDGAHRVTYQARDNAGNVADGELFFNIDTLLPVVTVTNKGTESHGWYSAPFDVVVSASDSGSGMQSVRCYVDGVAGTGGVFSDTVHMSTEGLHEIEYKATDLAGNTVAGSLSVNYDAAAPDADIELAGAQGLRGWYTSEVQATITGNDGADGSDVGSITYVLNAGSPVTVTDDRAHLTISTPGYNIIEYYATDLAGNAGTHNTCEVSVDKLAPLIRSSRSPLANANGWNNGSVVVSYSTSDLMPGSGIDRTTVPADVKVDGEGRDQHVNRSIYDLAGNVAYSNLTGINIDSTAPEISAIADGPTGSGELYGGDVDLVLIASDALSGVQSIEYSLDKDQWKDYTEKIHISGGSDVIVYYRCTDMAGNIAYGEKTLRFEPRGSPATISMSELGYGNTTPTATAYAAPSPSPEPSTFVPASTSPEIPGTSQTPTASPAAGTEQVNYTQISLYSIIALLLAGALVGAVYLWWRNQ